MINNPLNESPWAFPVLEYLHILGLICGVGTIALVDFRLLGVALTGKSAARLWSDTLPWTAGGLSLVIFSGLLLFSINPDVYYFNYTFLFKMLMLALAILFYYTIVRKVACKMDGLALPRGNDKIVATLSLTLWTLVLFGGIFIGLSATRPPAPTPPPTGVDFDEFLTPRK